MSKHRDIKAQQENKLNLGGFWLVFALLAGLLLAGIYCALRFGTEVYSHAELIRTLQRPLVSNSLQDIIVDIRLPRVLAAVLVGAAMAVSGAVMQGVTRNPIADPGLLGINAGAGFALAVGYAFWPGLHYGSILLLCLLGAVLAAFLVFGLAYRPGRGYSQLRLILAGAMVAALFSAVGQALTLYFKLSEAIIGWQAGGLAGTNWSMLMIIAPFILLGLLLAQVFARQLTILSLNETVARALGQRTLLMTVLLLGVVLLLASASVALVGSLSFVGLILPHAVRRFVRQDYRLILPLTALAGAVFLVWIDLLGRSIDPPAETPLSTIISLIGVPAFLWLLRRETHL